MAKGKNLPNNKQFGKSLPKIRDILSAPLVAAASANSTMVREQTRFLMDTCFVAKGFNRFEPLMIEMTLSKTIISTDENDKPQRQNILSSFKIPLLTLVPLNSLVVESVDVDFSLEIVSHTANQSERSITKEEENRKKNLLNKDSQSEESMLAGKLSYDSKDKTTNRSHNASKLNVNIHAASIPLPHGVTTLIDLYVKSINAVPNQKQKKNDK